MTKANKPAMPLGFGSTEGLASTPVNAGMTRRNHMETMIQPKITGKEPSNNNLNT